MITADQSEILDFLAKPTSYPEIPGRIERIDTHAAIVFLAGDRAYKVKRAVTYDYLDFSTLDRRKTCCEAELRLNRRTAPALYLDVLSVARGADGRLAWGSTGTIVEWILVMRRFPQDMLFDRLAASGALDAAIMTTLADGIARFHDGAERVSDHGGRNGMSWVIEGNAHTFAAADAGLDLAATHAVTALSRAALERHGDLLDARRLGGFVRRCHGDLHLRNIVLLDGQPTLFDAVEFNDEIACVDVLYDLAFLLMDLLHRDLPALANVVFNRYVSTTRDLQGLSLLPVFLGCRAAILAKTSATAASLTDARTRAAELRALAREYLSMAERLLKPSPPVLVAIGGFSGTGKSTLAAALGPHIGASPGALILRTDVIRKALFNVPETERLSPMGYCPDVSRTVYALVAERASLALSAGHAVIADGVYAEAQTRETIAGVAERAGVPFVGIWLDAPSHTLGSRLDARRADASDANRAILEKQLEKPTGPVIWQRIDASGTARETERLARLAMQPIVQLDTMTR